MKISIFTLPIVTLWFMYSCTSDISGSTDETITGKPTISLYGKVLDGKNDGVPNAVVKLTKLGFADTTNSEGIYNIFVSEDTLQKYDVDLSVVSDSVEYVKDNSIITTVKVENWIDTLPEVYIIQRNVSGKLNTTYKEFKRVEAVIKNISDSTASVKSVDLWLSTNTFNYSGYVYSINTVGVQEYSLYVNVYDKDSIFVGRSATEVFPSTAGDIVLGDFDPFNALPNVNTGKDFTVSINDVIKLYGIVVDSFGGVATKWEWDVGNTGVFIASTPYGCHVVNAPSIADSSYDCILRVTDNDGNVVLDTVAINVIWDAPICSASTTTPEVFINDTIKLFGSAYDIYGTVDKWEWKINDGDWTKTSTLDTSIVAGPVQAYICSLRVVDDDGVIGFSSVHISVNKWMPITDSCISYTSLGEVDLYIDKNDVPYVYFSSDGAKIMKLDSTSWTHVGTPGIINSNVVNLSFTKENKPIIVTRDTLVTDYKKSKINVWMYDNTDWIKIDSGLIFSNENWSVSTAISDDGYVYLAVTGLGLLSNSVTNVFMFDGVNWSQIAENIFQEYSNSSIAVDDRKNVYISSPNNTGIVSVKKYNRETGWENVGSDLVLGVYMGKYTSIDVRSSDAVVLAIKNCDIKNFNFDVLKFNGSSWQYLNRPSIIKHYNWYNHNFSVREYDDELYFSHGTEVHRFINNKWTYFEVPENSIEFKLSKLGTPYIVINEKIDKKINVLKYITD